jgi:hypothetical protein
MELPLLTKISWVIRSRLDGVRALFYREKEIELPPQRIKEKIKVSDIQENRQTEAVNAVPAANDDLALTPGQPLPARGRYILNGLIIDNGFVIGPVNGEPYKQPIVQGFMRKPVLNEVPQHLIKELERRYTEGESIAQIMHLAQPYLKNRAYKSVYARVRQYLEKHGLLRVNQQASDAMKARWARQRAKDAALLAAAQAPKRTQPAPEEAQSQVRAKVKGATSLRQSLQNLAIEEFNIYLQALGVEPKETIEASRKSLTEVLSSVELMLSVSRQT